MASLLLLSLLPATLAVPLWAARARSPGAGLRRAVAAMLAFQVLYQALLASVLPL